MTTYAISSVKGNFQDLIRLLDKINFDRKLDHLWFTGNLIGNGPESLNVLRFIKDLGKQALIVLGDQELRLLGIASGFIVTDSSDNLNEIFAAPDREDILKWIRRSALLHHDSKLKFTMVHAGITAQWSLSQCLAFSYEVESALSGNNYVAFMENRRLDQSIWHAKLRGWKRLNYITNAFTQMKYCEPDGRMSFTASGAVSHQTENLLPWYKVPNRETAQLRIIFSDDAHFSDEPFPGVYPLADSVTPSALILSEIPELVHI